MAVAVAAVGRWCRRPALVHGLWLLVLIKLITPSFWPVSIQKFFPSPAEPGRAAVDASPAQPLLEGNAAQTGPQLGKSSSDVIIDDLSETALPDLSMLQDDVSPEPMQASVPPVAS